MRRYRLSLSKRSTSGTTPPSCRMKCCAIDSVSSPSALIHEACPTKVHSPPSISSVPTDRRLSESSQPHETDTLVFDLRVRCDRRPDAIQGETDPRKLYYDSNVYAGMLEWVPSGDQPRRYASNPPKPVDPDILLVKLRPGQVSQSQYSGETPLNLDR